VVLNGVGVKTCSNGGFSPCVATSCDALYVLDPLTKECTPTRCTPGQGLECEIENGSGRKTCPATGIFSDCTAVGCDEGYELNAATCIETPETETPLIEGESWTTTPVIIGVAVGVVVLLGAIGGAVAFIVYRKRKKNQSMDQPMSEIGLNRGVSSQSLLGASSSPSPSIPLYPPSSSVYPAVTPKSSFRVPPIAPVMPPKFRVGMQCQAKYSKDGKFYRAVIDDIRVDDCLVRYVDFGNDSEWVPLSSLRM
jgi:hypothetical protein